ncbi:13206_t:CDS:2 [Rhizophagus irregularis]|nr:13206_t:CDS:2 [Rhizophagus irregularis]
MGNIIGNIGCYNKGNIEIITMGENSYGSKETVVSINVGSITVRSTTVGCITVREYCRGNKVVREIMYWK